VGLAGLSVLTRCDAMMDWARRSYGTALQLTNEALKNAKEAVKDSTVLSVLILGTYEMLTGRTPQTVKAWQEHVNGAAALVNMRGTAQFHTNAGIRMFMMSHQTLMIACMHQDIPMPQALIDLRDELGRMIGTEGPGWRIPEPIYKALQVRYDVHRGVLTDTDVIIEKLTSIDEECVQICADFPKVWAYQVVRISRSNPMVLGTYCHIYPSVLIANAWNGIRTIRLLAHETIIGEIFKNLGGNDPQTLPSRHKRQLMRSVAILKRVRDALVASVPQYFGAVSFRDTTPSETLELSPSIIDAKDPPHRVVPSLVKDTWPISSPSLSPNDLTCPTILDPMQSKGSHGRVDRFMTVASASHTIVWPLYVVGMASCCTQEIKEYAVERLLQIHGEGALAQARSVALMVQEKEICCPWAAVSFDNISPVEPPSSPI
jgi:Fungal specific transcription factor domain